MSAPSSPQSASAQSLSPLLPILNAFNHRHHNQHRLAHWWPVFRILRRTIRNLVDDLTPPSSSLSSRPAHREISTSSSPPPRAVWLKKHFLPRAYIAFTQLAADNQHAPLGLLLLTILARVHTALSNLLSDDNNPNPVKALSSNRSNDSSNQDKGVAIARQELTPANKINTPPPTERPQLSKLDRDAVKPPKTKSKDTPSSSLASSSKEKKKKKKGKGDELSSLFGSLA